MAELRRQLLNFTPLPPVVPFNGADESTWTLRQSNLVLDGDGDETFNPSFLLPSGTEILLDPDRFITLGSLRTGIRSDESPVWTDPRAIMIISRNEGAFQYRGSVALDTANVLRAFVSAQRTGQPAGDSTEFIQVYRFVVAEPDPLPSIQANITSIRHLMPEASEVPDQALSMFLAHATQLVEDRSSTLPDATKNIVITYVACHLTTLASPQATEEKQGDRQTKFEGIPAGGMNLQLTRWGQMALAFDHTGGLRQLGKQQASITIFKGTDYGGDGYPGYPYTY